MPAHKKFVVQRFVNDFDGDLPTWVDTLFSRRDIARARREWPKEIYRIVQLIPEEKKSK